MRYFVDVDGDPMLVPEAWDVFTRGAYLYRRRSTGELEYQPRGESPLFARLLDDGRSYERSRAAVVDRRAGFGQE